MRRIMHTVYLGLGSNLGDKTANLDRAITLIGERVGMVLRRSSFIESEPWGFQSDNRFLNAVILCTTEKTPHQVLNLTQQIERELGRKKPYRQTGTLPSGRRYADRPIDIDILLYDDLHIDTPDLKIPHPLMHERDFVMQPLNEIRENN